MNAHNIIMQVIHVQLLLFLCFIVIDAYFDEETNVECKGKTFENVTLTAYYPDYNDSDQGFTDKNGKKLRTLQDYIDDRSDFVTMAMDETLGIPYGTTVCIPELNKHFGHKLKIQVRDSSSDLLRTGYSRADICVRSEMDSYDIIVNRMVTLVFENRQT